MIYANVLGMPTPLSSIMADRPGRGDDPMVLELRPRDSSRVQRHTVTTVNAGLQVEHLETLQGLDVARGRSWRIGWWWSSTTRGHVPFASKYQRTCLMVLDADPQVSWIVHSPIALNRGPIRVVPPYVVSKDGRVNVVFGSPGPSNGSGDRRALLEEWCLAAGWNLLELDDLSIVAERTLRWIAGYRHHRNSDPSIEDRLLQRFTKPYPLWDGADAVGPLSQVLPVVYHLLWIGELCVDIEEGLDRGTLIWSRFP